MFLSFTSSVAALYCYILFLPRIVSVVSSMVKIPLYNFLIILIILLLFSYYLLELHFTINLSETNGFDHVCMRTDHVYTEIILCVLN